MQADENVPSWGIPSKMFNVNPISTEFVREVLKSAGSTHITINFLPLELMAVEVLENIRYHQFNVNCRYKVNNYK